MLSQNFFSHVRIAQRALGVPYYIGNEIAIDLLNLQENEMLDSEQADENLTRDYSILSAGCGNIRNLIYTITSLPKEFQGKLQVTMNDIDPFIQARNLLFLFMMIYFSADPGIASVVTTIWYSLHLPEHAYKILIDTLNLLCTASRTELKEMSKAIIDVSEDDLEVLRQVWQGWLNFNQQEKTWRSVSLAQQREQMFKEDPASAAGLESYKAVIPKRHKTSAVSWVENGDFLPSGKTAKDQRENPTLTGRREQGIGRVPFGIRVNTPEELAGAKTFPKDTEFVYCVTSDLMPFGEWDYLEAAQYSNAKSLIVMAHAFITHQIQEAIGFIDKQRLRISLILGNCQELKTTGDKAVKEKFDRIFTSNIADYIGTKTLLDAMKPLLSTTNKNAVIVTQYLNWSRYFPKAYADYPMYLLDGSHSKWIDAARKDTGTYLPNLPRHWYQEYFNNTSFFIDYLRLALMANNLILGEENEDEKVPTFKEVKEQCSGLHMRDFRYHLNKVAPWKYRCNARAVNMLPGIARMLEWHIP